MPETLLLLSALAKIALGYTQCLGAIIRFPLVEWPDLFTRFIETMDLLNLELFAIVPAECITRSRLGFFIELMATLLAPIACVLGLTLLVWLADLLDRFEGVRNRYGSWRAYRAGLLQRLNHPKSYTLLIWTFLLLYPSIARKSLSIFDCLEAGTQTGKTTFLLRDDPVIECYQDEWRFWAIIAGLSIGIYCLGMPLAGFLAAWRFHSSAKDNPEMRKRVALIVGAYESQYWYMESLVLLHRFAFTGAIHVAFPESALQLFIGSAGSLFAYIGFLLTRPFCHDLCDAVGGAALLQLLLTYLAAMLFFDPGAPTLASQDKWRSSPLTGAVLVGANSICFILLFIAMLRTLHRARHTAITRRLRYVDTDEPVLPRVLGKGERYHIFLSHSWVSGQDAMRIVKQRLLEMIPDLSIFLDVDLDQLEIKDLEKYVDASQVVLAFLSTGYFSSHNCMRELKRSAATGKRIIAMLDPEASKGGLSLREVRAQAADQHLSADCFAEAPIEWNRLGIFQDVTLKLVAARLLPEDRVLPRTSRWEGVDGQLGIYCSGEQKNAVPAIPAPRLGRRFHLFVSVHNRGAHHFVAELNAYVQKKRHVTDDAASKRWLQAKAFANEITGCAPSVTHSAPLRLAPPEKRLRREGSSRRGLLARGGSVLVAMRRGSLARGLAPAAALDEASSGGSFRRGDGSKRGNDSSKRGSDGSKRGSSKRTSSKRQGLRTAAEEAPSPLASQCSGGRPLPLKGSAGQLGLLKDESDGRLLERVAAKKGSHQRIQACRKEGDSGGGGEGEPASLIYHTSRVREMGGCEAMLIYLNLQTWDTSSSTYAQLSAEIARALIDGVPLLLVHETPGIEGNHARHACEFATFFQPSATPAALIGAGVYGTTAIAVKGGAWRLTSLLNVAKRFEREPAPPPPLAKRVIVQLEMMVREAQSEAARSVVGVWTSKTARSASMRRLWEASAGVNPQSVVRQGDEGKSEREPAEEMNPLVELFDRPSVLEAMDLSEASLVGSGGMASSRQVAGNGATSDAVDWSSVELKERIGNGSMGAIFVIVLQGDSRTLALRRFHLDVLHIHHHTPGSLREETAALAAMPSDVHLLRILGMATDQTHYGQLMELMPHSLAHVLRRAATSEQAASRMASVWLNMAIEVTRGLQSLHTQGLAHLSLHPRNVLLDGGMHVRLADYGRSSEVLRRQLRADAIRLDEVVATIKDPARRQVLSEVSDPKGLYLSPELLAGRVVADEKADLWSLGVLLVRLVTLRPPYSTQSGAAGAGGTATCSDELGAIVERIVNGELEPSLEVDSAAEAIASADTKGPLRQIVAACTEREPLSRPPIGEALEALLALQESRHAASRGSHTRRTSCETRTTAVRWQELRTTAMDNSTAGAHKLPAPTQLPEPPRLAPRQPKTTLSGRIFGMSMTKAGARAEATLDEGSGLGEASERRLAWAQTEASERRPRRRKLSIASDKAPDAVANGPEGSLGAELSLMHTGSGRVRI